MDNPCSGSQAGRYTALHIFLRSLAKRASVLVILLGCIVILGWIFNIPLLKSILPFWVTMKVNTAICFILSGYALQQLSQSTRQSARYAQIAAAIVLSIGLLTLVQYGFGLNLGIDQLLFQEPVTAVATSAPGRMAINTALNFLLLSSALILLSKPRSFQPGIQTFTVIAFFMALLGLLGYLYGVQEFYGFGSYTKMAVHTAIAFIILCTGILCLHPDQGIMEMVTSQHAGGVMTRRLLLTVLGVPPILSGIILAGYRAKLYSGEVGLSLSAVCSILVFAVVIWRNAKVLGNVDARRQQAEERRQSEERFRSLITATAQIVWTTNATGRVLEDSPSWTAFTGQTFEEYQGWGWLTTIHPDDSAHVACMWSEAVNSRSLYKIEFRMRRHDGEYRYMSCRAVPILQPDGTIREWIGANTDITERQQAEVTLKQSEERFRSLIEATSQIVWSTDAAGCFITDLPQWRAFTGQRIEEMLGWGWLKAIHPDDQAISEQRWTEALSTCTPYEAETRIRRYDGEYRYMNIRGVPILNTDGSIREWIGTNTDIHDRKQAQIALAQAKDAAEAANRAKSEFLANMSHELRTPLNGVIGYAQILQRTNTLSEEDRSRVAVIQQCGSHLLTLINDILDLSKIEARKVELTPTDFHLPAFLQGVAEMCRIRAELKGIHFQYESASELPIGIRADEKRLRQVLINLLSNAIKFTDTGSVHFTVSCASAEKIRFEVRDTGTGIPQEKLQLIFQPFEQVSDAKRQAEGTGLGLAISQEIVELMGSTIQVQSEVGVGSIFWFDAELTQADEWAKTAQCDQHGQIIGIKGKQPKILVVDDRWENRSVVSSLLNLIGFEVLEAMDGNEGWQKILEFHPDLVITDLLMPNTDGFELIKRIRKSETFKDLIVIVSSASVFESDQYHSIEAGGNDFLPKPVLAVELLHKLQTHLQLEWIYEEQKSPMIPGMDNSELVIPPIATLEILYELAMKGHFKGITKQATLLEQMDQKYSPFAKKLHQLAKGFQDREILALIQSYR